MSAGRVPPAPVPFTRDAAPSSEGYAGYLIPGSFYAEIAPDGLTVLRFVFTPAASAPGYWGASAEWCDGDELGLGDDAGDDGPGVWPAIRRELAGHARTTEDGSAWVAVEWVE